MVGMSYFFAQLQEPDQPLTVKDTIIIMGSLVLGLGPKAIYFPLFALLLLLPKSKFSSVQQYRKYLVIVSVAAVLVLMSFVIPMLFGSVPSDTRGGSTAVSYTHLKFVLYL